MYKNDKARSEQAQIVRTPSRAVDPKGLLFLLQFLQAEPEQQETESVFLWNADELGNVPLSPVDTPAEDHRSAL